MDNTSTDLKQLAKQLQENPELRAFFNQQVHLLAPLLLESGTCGIELELPDKNNLDVKRVKIFYDVNGEVLESYAEGKDIYQVTIAARETMEESLNKIINLMTEEDPNTEIPKLLH